MPVDRAEFVVQDRRLVRMAAVSVALGLLIVFVLAPSRFRFWYDSWTYYELARSIGSRFYAVSTIREFQSGSEFSSAFPPLWPAIVATFSRSGLGMFGSYLASFISFAAFALTAERLARRLFTYRGIGLLSALLLLAFPGIRWDLAGGGSFALYLCLLALLGLLFLRFDPARLRDAVWLGAIAGLMVMLRFDAAPAALAALAAGIAFGVRRARLAAMVATFALVLSPWIFYSWLHFHTLFVTDNRAVALALDPDAYVMDYLPGTQPTLRDNPAAWVRKLLVHTPIIARAVWDAVMQSVFVLPACITAIGAWVMRHQRDFSFRLPRRLTSHALLALVVVAMAPILAYVVTGYQESRYFSTFVWLGELLALGVATAALPPRARLWLFAIACVAGLAKSVSLARYARTDPPLAAMRRQLDSSDAVAMTSCLRAAGAVPGDGVLFVTNVGLLNGYRFGALTGWRASPPPRNWVRLTAEQRARFVQQFRLRYVLDTLPAAADRLPSEPVAGCTPAVRRLTANAP